MVVRDMDGARAEIRAMYGDRPGLDFVYDFFPDSVWTNGVKMKEKCQIRICMVDWIDGMKLEILEPILGTGYEHDRFLANFGPGMHHIAYYLKEGWAEHRQYLLDQGARILFESETNDDRGYRRCCYLKCPNTGLVIEIAEPPAPFPNRPA